MKGSSMNGVVVLGLMVLGMISCGMMLMPVAVEGADKVSCQDAVSQLSSCTGFLRNPDDSATPSPQCCLGAQALDKIASASETDRKILCQCLKKTAESDTSINYNNAKKLPKSCQLSTQVTIDPNVDCNKV